MSAAGCRGDALGLRQKGAPTTDDAATKATFKEGLAAGSVEWGAMSTVDTLMSLPKWAVNTVDSLASLEDGAADTMTVLPKWEANTVDNLDPLEEDAVTMLPKLESNADWFAPFGAEASEVQSEETSDDWQRWLKRREARRSRLAPGRAARAAQFGSQGHVSFCSRLCSSDCRHGQ
ncbi:unnamed protein product [Prorocentrum cordatum]|uniref:Uncharacterized protein n=1 Tax=Prorocentrum cordatum TaxID=2364126 RepID=A0ABN9WF48_9DINO|nr:unnamed protein product [Polarella glacialis]